ncbi:MAG: isocitrate/isopropylmalate family dehydrogenase, partial [Haloferacaceae archaeon]
MTHDIAVAPGDGIGPAVIDAAFPVLEAASAAAGTAIDPTLFDLGAERYLDTGDVLAPDTIDRLRDHDAVLLGAVGHPDVDNAAVAAAGHHRIRREFDLYANVRPARLLDAAVSPLKGYDAGDVDLLWFRENGEGMYVDAGGRLTRRASTEVALQCALHTRGGIERIARTAFEAAATDGRDGLVHSVTKSNVLSHGDAFWDEVVAEVAAD